MQNGMLCNMNEAVGGGMMADDLAQQLFRAGDDPTSSSSMAVSGVRSWLQTPGPGVAGKEAPPQRAALDAANARSQLPAPSPALTPVKDPTSELFSHSRLVACDPSPCVFHFRLCQPVPRCL